MTNYRKLATRVDVVYEFVHPGGRITFRVLGLTESGRLEILQQGFLRRYIEVDMLALCLEHGAIAEVSDWRERQEAARASVEVFRDKVLALIAEWKARP